MGQSRRRQSTGRRLKRSLLRRFRYSPLIRLLVLKPWFRAAFILMIACLLLPAIYLPKIWRTSPEGFTPEIRISWMDLTQCWSLKRSAKKAAGTGDFENAEFSWQMAVAQNPGDISALRGYLDNFFQLTRPDRRQGKTAVGQMAWLLRIAETNQADVLRIARICDKFGWYEPASTFLDGIPNLPPEAEVVAIKALFHQGKFKEFRERWAEARNRINDPSLALYERAHAMGWGVGEEAKNAEADLAAAAEEPQLAARAARLYMLAASQQGNIPGYEKGLQRLINLNEARVTDHAGFWSLLASQGRKEEAVKFAGQFTTSPQNVTEMIRLADVYFGLGLTDSAREILARFVPQFSSSMEGWTFYANFLQQIKDWPSLRSVAIRMRDEQTLYGKLWGYSYYLQGLADHRQNLTIGAAVAFQKAAEATYELPAVAYRVATELVNLGQPAHALKILQGIEESQGSSLAFWETYFQAAHDARDAEAVLIAAERAYQLKPRDVHLHNRYAAALMLNRKDPEESIKLTLQLINTYPESVAAKINHGFALLLNRRQEEARQLLESLAGRTLGPVEANAWHLGLFEVYYSLELWEKAWREADQVNTTILFPSQLESFQQKREALPERVVSSS